MNSILSFIIIKHSILTWQQLAHNTIMPVVMDAKEIVTN
jgi:hypothetical protein